MLSTSEPLIVFYFIPLAFEEKPEKLHITMQFLNNAMFGVHRNGPCYKGAILLRKYRTMTFGLFPIILL